MRTVHTFLGDLMRMRRFQRAITALTVTVLAATTLAGLGAGSSAAAAATATTAVLISPTSGQTVPYHFTGPFTLDLSAAPADTYRARVACSGANGANVDETVEVVWDGATDPVRSFSTATPLPTTTPGYLGCIWQVYPKASGAAGAQYVFARFAVAAQPRPKVTTPEANTQVPADYRGPFTVDMSPAPTGDYGAQVSCHDDVEGSTFLEDFANFTWDGTGEPVRSFTLARKLPAGSAACWFVVYMLTDSGADGTWDGVDFSVDDGPVTIGGFTQAPSTFYPRVRDGYRDTTTTSFFVSRWARVRLQVITAAGDPVFTRLEEMDGDSTRHWAWNGRNRSGAKVPVGKYTLILTARDANGDTDRATSTVTVATKTVTRTGTQRLVGRVGDRAAANRCTAVRADQTMELDCWGGRQASARYRFAVPATTFKTSFTVAGFTPDADICCDGSISKTSSRPSKQQLAVQVQVTGWRAYTVKWVTASWSYRQRL